MVAEVGNQVALKTKVADKKAASKSHQKKKSLKLNCLKIN